LEISEAQIFDGSEVVLKQSGEPIMPMWGFMNSHVHISRLDTRVVTIGSDWLCIRKEPISQIPIEGCVSLLSPMSSDFGHFILDLLFRLKHYDQNSDLQKDYPLILLDSSLPDPFFRFLKLLFPSYAFTKVDPGSSYTVNRLLLPLPSSLICHDFLLGKAITEGSHFDIEDLEWIHAKIRHSSLTKKIKHGLKIYISRGRNPRWRKLVNEQEIIQNLIDLDFKIIHPEDFSLLELSEFFARAEVIVFSAGSVTFNLCFANPEASIIILISKGFINDLGKAILTTYYFSNKFKNWFMIQGESSPGRLYTEDYYISTRILRKTLKKIMSTRIR
jgi:capsular polysaccharide biosynthesis protein